MKSNATKIHKVKVEPFELAILKALLISCPDLYMRSSLQICFMNEEDCSSFGGPLEEPYLAGKDLPDSIECTVSSIAAFTDANVPP